MIDKAAFAAILPVLLVGMGGVAPWPVGAEEVPEESRLDDHMRGFDAFVAALGEGASAAAIRAAYRLHFESRDPTLYRTFVGDLDEMPDQRLERVASLVRERSGEIRKAHVLARAQVPVATLRAAATFGPEAGKTRQVVTVNLLQANAQVRLLKGKATILYGIDTLGVFGERWTPSVGLDLRATIAHELFHAHHWSSNPFMAKSASRFLPPRSDAPIWIQMWSEGLANCAARRVYPGIDIAHVMALEGVWEATAARLPAVADELKGALDSNDPGLTAEWFFLDNRRDDLPAKAGYVLGTMVAHQVVEERGWEAATLLEGDELRAAVGTAMRRIATAGAPASPQTVCVLE